jgi:hypothetical protein
MRENTLFRAISNTQTSLGQSVGSRITKHNGTRMTFSLSVPRSLDYQTSFDKYVYAYAYVYVYVYEFIYIYIYYIYLYTSIYIPIPCLLQVSPQNSPDYVGPMILQEVFKSFPVPNAPRGKRGAAAHVISAPPGA